MCNFTKGPWIVYKESDWYGSQDWDEIVIGVGTYNENPYNHYCCHKIVIECDESDAEAIANAHLIAAAPDMYGLLGKVLTEYKEMLGMSQEVKEIEQLLAKARGEHV